jgi:hypothetical protein
MSFADLSERMRRQRGPILAAWRDRVLEAYPAEAAKFFGNRGRSFANPVGSTVMTGTEAVFDALLAGRRGAELEAEIDGIVRTRAVQDLSASEAVGFVFGLKGAVRDGLGRDAREPAVAEDLAELDRRVDELALAAFDVYTRCREKVHDLKARMMRDRSYKLMERAGLLWEEETKRGDGR